MDGILETAVIKDERVGREAGPEGTVGRVDHSGPGHGLEEIVGADGAGGVSGTDGRIARVPWGTTRFPIRLRRTSRTGGTCRACPETPRSNPRLSPGQHRHIVAACSSVGVEPGVSPSVSSSSSDLIQRNLTRPARPSWCLSPISRLSHVS